MIVLKCGTTPAEKVIAAWNVRKQLLEHIRNRNHNNTSEEKFNSMVDAL